MLGQIDAIGQIVGGILIGIFANMLGLRFAMIGVGLLLCQLCYSTAGRTDDSQAR